MTAPVLNAGEIEALRYQLREAFDGDDLTVKNIALRRAFDALKRIEELEPRPATDVVELIAFETVFDTLAASAPGIAEPIRRGIATSITLKLFKRVRAEAEPRPAADGDMVERVAVKPLEWGEHALMPEGWRRWSAAPLSTCYFIDQQTPDSKFVVTFYGWGTHGKPPIGEFDTVSAAKAAAQADHDQRIRAALSAMPDVEELRREVERLTESVEHWMNEFYDASSERDKVQARIAKLTETLTTTANHFMPLMPPELATIIRAALSDQQSDLASVYEPTVVTLSEAGLHQFVVSDEPTVSRLPETGNYETLHSMQTGQMIGVQWPVSDPAPALHGPTIEACAKVAEEFRDPNPFPTVYGAIASAIRALEQTS